MEPGEHALIERLSQENDELRQLWGEHLAYEHRLGELARLRYLTEPEQAEMARIKRKKLAGKDRIELLLGQARRAEGWAAIVIRGLYCGTDRWYSARH